MKVALVVVALGAALLLAVAWNDAGIQPVRPLTVPATLPDAAR